MRNNKNASNELRVAEQGSLYSSHEGLLTNSLTQRSISQLGRRTRCFDCVLSYFSQKIGPGNAPLVLP